MNVELRVCRIVARRYHARRVDQSHDHHLSIRETPRSHPLGVNDIRFRRGRFLASLLLRLRRVRGCHLNSLLASAVQATVNHHPHAYRWFSRLPRTSRSITFFSSSMDVFTCLYTCLIPATLCATEFSTRGWLGLSLASALTR